MKRAYHKSIVHIIIALLVLSLAGCGNQDTKTENRDLTLEVALYPYVPDMERFEAAVRERWAREHSDVTLHFVDWDCYSSDPDPALDVFVFDSIYLTSFVEAGYLLPIPEERIREREDILPFALEGCVWEGKLYALPQLLCTDFLYTRKDDTELSGVSDVMSLYEILGDRKTQSLIPEENEGLLINLSDVLVTKTMMYLDALMDEQEEYTDYSDLPEPSALSDSALERIVLLWKMGGEKQVSYWPENDDTYIRARWFAEGKGRAYIGYAEAMEAMGDYADEVTVRPLSYGTENNIALYYADLIGISATIQEEKKGLAFDLANLLMSEEFLTGMSLPAEEDEYPQYLLTPRRSVYNTLSKDYPIYRLLLENVDSADNHVFRVGANAREFFSEMEPALSERILQDGTA